MKHAGIFSSLIVFALAIALAIYAFYLRFVVAAPPLFQDAPVASLVAVIAIALLVWMAYGEFRWPSRYSGRQATSPNRPQAPTQNSYWLRSGGLILIVAMIYLRHTQYSGEANVWVDQYWQILLPGILVFTGLYWLYDTLAAPIINGSHSGHSALTLRSQLVLKRSGVLMLVLAICALTNIHMSDLMQESYRSPLAGILLAAIYAVLASFTLIGR